TTSGPVGPIHQGAALSSRSLSHVSGLGFSLLCVSSIAFLSSGGGGTFSNESLAATAGATASKSAARAPMRNAADRSLVICVDTARHVLVEQRDGSDLVAEALGRIRPRGRVVKRRMCCEIGAAIVRIVNLEREHFVGLHIRVVVPLMRRI